MGRQRGAKIWLGLCAAPLALGAPLTVQRAGPDTRSGPAQGTPRPVQPGATLEKTQVLTTGNASATLEGPCGRVDVGPHTELSLDACDPQAGLSLDLRGGSAAVQAARGMPAQIVTNRGTAKTVDGRTRVEVASTGSDLGTRDQQIRMQALTGTTQVALTPVTKPPALPSVPSPKAETEATRSGSYSDPNAPQASKPVTAPTPPAAKSAASSAVVAPGTPVELQSGESLFITRDQVVRTPQKR